MTDAIFLETESIRAWHVIRITGYLHVSNIQKLRAQFEEIEKKRISRIGLDLSGVTGLDSSALGLIANFNKRLKKIHCRLCLFAPNEDVNSILHMISFEKTTILYTTREEFLHKETV